MKDKFFATLDIEYTSYKGSLARNWSLPYEFPEVVEIGVTKFKSLNSNNIKTINLIFEIERKNLSFYFQKLTNINQNYFNNFSKKPENQYKKLDYFLKDVKKIYCIGADKEIIKKNLKKKKLNFNFHEKIIDIRPTLAKILNKKEVEIVSSKLLTILEEKEKFKAHRALDDAKSVWLCLKKILKKFEISEKELIDMLS